MKKYVLIAMLVVGLIVAGFAARMAMAANTDTTTVTIVVSAINELDVPASVSLTVDAATAGSQPNDASSAGLTYAVTTNQTGAKITASIDLAMPTGTTLYANLIAPTGATSLGAVSLSTIAADVVTDITKLAESKGVTYTLSATASAGVVASTTRTATFTLTGGI